MNEKKICLVGAFAVGKTSLIQRYINGIFSDTYLQRVGVKVESRDVIVDGEQTKLALWDIQADEQVTRIPPSYLKGAAAIVYVVDGTRLDTLQSARKIKREAEGSLERAVPSFFLFNKSDLASQWEINAAMLREIDAEGSVTLLTSAREGSGVSTAFGLISRVVMGKSALASSRA